MITITYKIVVIKIIEQVVPEIKYTKLDPTEPDSFGSEREKDKYGYIDTGRTEIKVTTKEVYNQTVDTLNFSALVSVVNELDIGYIG